MIYHYVIEYKNQYGEIKKCKTKSFNLHNTINMLKSNDFEIIRYYTVC